MKKIVSLILAICILVPAFTATVSAEEELTSAQKLVLMLTNADADGNGYYSTADAKLILSAAAGIEASLDNYDVNLDGVVSVTDSLAVLKEIAGVEPIVSKEMALDVFNGKINTVKEENPGFDKTYTMHCSSMLITTTGAPLAKLNVTNMEYDDYVDRIVDVMSSPIFSAAMDDDMKAQLDAMKVSAVDAYQPKSQTYNADTGDNVAHREFFPIANIAYSSNLTVTDIKNITCRLSNGCIVYTITMDECSYVGDEYPTGAYGFAGRLKLPYGKVFNIMSLDESDGSTLNNVTYKNGSVILKERVSDGKILETHYNYDYISDVSAAPQDSLTMKTVMTTNVKEDVIFK